MIIAVLCASLVTVWNTVQQRYMENYSKQLLDYVLDDYVVKRLLGFYSIYSVNSHL